MFEIEVYETAEGKRPYMAWLQGLKDNKAAALIARKVASLLPHGGGDRRGLDGGLFELKLDHGPGYRVYCGQQGQKLIIVLCGGDKSSQTKDIKLAQEYWDDFKKRS